MYLKSVIYANEKTIEDVYSDVKKVKTVLSNMAYIHLENEEENIWWVLCQQIKGSDKFECQTFVAEEPLIYKEPLVKTTEKDFTGENEKKVYDEALCAIIVLTMEFNDGSTKVLHGYPGSFYLMDNSGKTINKY